MQIARDQASAGGKLMLRLVLGGGHRVFGPDMLTEPAVPATTLQTPKPPTLLGLNPHHLGPGVWHNRPPRHLALVCRPGRHSGSRPGSRSSARGTNPDRTA